MPTIQNLLCQQEQFRESEGTGVHGIISVGFFSFYSLLITVVTIGRESMCVGRERTERLLEEEWGGGWILPCCGFCFSQRTSENDCVIPVLNKQHTCDSFRLPSTPSAGFLCVLQMLIPSGEELLVLPQP